MGERVSQSDCSREEANYRGDLIQEGEKEGVIVEEEGGIDLTNSDDRRRDGKASRNCRYEREDLLSVDLRGRGAADASSLSVRRDNVIRSRRAGVWVRWE